MATSEDIEQAIGSGMVVKDVVSELEVVEGGEPFPKKRNGGDAGLDCSLATDNISNRRAQHSSRRLSVRRTREGRNGRLGQGARWMPLL